MADDSPYVINTTDQTFDVDVIERSRLGLVVVDFWAQWCAPCRMLGPVLEQIATEANGEFTLVKAETDHNPNAATQFAVGGIPAVFAVYQGEVIDRSTQVQKKGRQTIVTVRGGLHHVKNPERAYK